MKIVPQNVDSQESRKTTTKGPAHATIHMVPQDHLTHPQQHFR